MVEALTAAPLDCVAITLNCVEYRPMHTAGAAMAGDVRSQELVGAKASAIHVAVDSWEWVSATTSAKVNALWHTEKCAFGI